MTPVAILLLVVLFAGAVWWWTARDASTPIWSDEPQELPSLRRANSGSTELVRVGAGTLDSSPNLGGSDVSGDFEVRATGELLIAGPQRIIDLVRSLPTLGMLGNEDEARISALRAVTFRLQFDVDELLDTVSADQPAMKGGKTAVGALEEGVVVRVQLSAQYLGTTVEGATLFVLARVSRWDAPTRSLVLCESVS